jgi:hypothetical protein
MPLSSYSVFNSGLSGLGAIFCQLLSVAKQPVQSNLIQLMQLSGHCVQGVISIGAFQNTIKHFWKCIIGFFIHARMDCDEII